MINLVDSSCSNLCSVGHKEMIILSCCVFLYNMLDYLVKVLEAGVAKWLRQWVVVPLFAGSIPVVRLLKMLYE